MLNLLGFRLHPVVGIVLGPVLIALGLLMANPILCVVGAAMALATGWRWFGSREEKASAGAEDPARSEHGSKS